MAFGGVGLTVTATRVDDAGRLVATVDVAQDADGGPHDLTVTNPDGGSARAGGAFTVTG